MTKSDRRARWAAVVALLAACTTRAPETAAGGEPTVESLATAPTLAAPSAATTTSAAAPAGTPAAARAGTTAAATTPAAPSGTAAPASAAAPAPAKATTLPTEPFSGVVTTRDHRVVPAEYTARVQRVLVHAGEPVHAGQPIAYLDDTDVRKELEQTKAQELQGEADMRKASVDLADGRRLLELEKQLYRKGASSKEQVRQKEMDLRKFEALMGSAQANYRRTTAQREQLEARLGKTTLYAPIDGIVSMIRVKEGDMAQQAMPVARVFNPSDLWLRFAAEPEYRDFVKPGAKVTVQVAGLPPINAVVTNVTLDLEPPNQFLVADADFGAAGVGRGAGRVGVVGRLSVAGAPTPTASGQR